MHDLAEAIKKQARAFGFELAGIAAATPADSFERLEEWLERGYAGKMDYMHRHVEARRHPRSILPEVKSVVMVGISYASRDEPGNVGPHFGRVARYARGEDYHDVIRTKLKELLAWTQQQAPECMGRAVVDTAPLLERDFARRAGLGWFGKNTMLIHPRQGSYIYLGALLLSLELSPDPSFDGRHCGTCTACLDACPTQAFPRPGELDSRRCISYLTIELRGAIPTELRSGIGDWIFGCDVCQEVCPWNDKAPAGRHAELGGQQDLTALDAVEVLSLSEEEWGGRFRGTAMRRAKWAGLKRNAAIVLGNGGDASALPVLRAAGSDPDESVREAAAWAIDVILDRMDNVTTVPPVPARTVMTSLPTE